MAVTGTNTHLQPEKDIKALLSPAHEKICIFYSYICVIRSLIICVQMFLLPDGFYHSSCATTEL